MTVGSDLCLKPVSVAAGQVDLPGSKSISNRVLLLAALASGTTHLDGLLDSDDTRVMLAALRQLGVPVTDTGPTRVQVWGNSPFTVKRADIFLGNAGTAFRPLTAALALMGGDYRLSGVARMHERPIGDLVDALVALGAEIEYQGTAGYPPLLIKPGVIDARDPVKVKGSVSSQFLTALLLAAPIQTKNSPNDLIIDVEGELISKPYILITLNLMAQFGVSVQRQGWQRFVVPAGSHYQSPGNVHIEGDASTASYFMALGAIGGGPIRIHGAGSQSIQGDMAFADVIESMGATVVRHPESIEVKGLCVAQGQKLKAFDRRFQFDSRRRDDGCHACFVRRWALHIA